MEEVDPITPDLLTPSQWADVHRSRLGPVQRLMLAILEDALRDFLKTRVGRRRVRWTPEHRRMVKRWKDRRAEEAAGWIFDEAADREGRLFSFKNICEVLGIEPERLRQRLRQGGPIKIERSNLTRELTVTPRSAA